MNPRLRFFRPALCLLLLPPAAAHAQWRSASYTLKSGWNSLYLPGDASHITLDEKFESNEEVLEVWRWNPNPTQVQFTTSPLIPSAGTPEWSVWIKGFPAASTLTSMTGPGAYLVKCGGEADSESTVSLTFHPVPPSTVWVRNGANFLGFPAAGDAATAPLFRDYFATFPAAIAPGSKIYKYVGGDLNPANPLQVFSTGTERLDRNQAYWFESEVVGNFYAPLEISSSVPGGLEFGRDVSAVVVRLRNRTNAVVTVTLAPVASDPVPAGQTAIADPAPLTLRKLNPVTLVQEETPVTASWTETIGPQSTVELSFGVNRADPSMTGAAVGAWFASLLKITDSGGMTEAWLPANALRSSLSGLWLGDIAVTNVGSRVSNPAQAQATVSDGQVTYVSITGTGGFGYTDPPAVTIAAPAGDSAATAKATAVVSNGSVARINVTNGGSGYAVASPKVVIAPPPPLAGTAVKEPFPLRAILHVADNGTVSLLSQVFMGPLAAAPSAVGLCTREALLTQDSKAGARRLVAAHLPLDQVITAGNGTVSVPGVLIRTIQTAYDDATNPFVHQYHPDHDNLNARFQPIPLPSGATGTTARISDGVEAPAITRTCTFTFTSSPPASSSALPSAWGSSVIGGTYSETITGVYKNTIQVNGTFELRRVSEIGVLIQ
ncbi:MAG: hypothetical protein V4726_00305 [Verrucomicrobiota bacterium]